MIVGILTGPTACGKSDIAEELAYKYNLNLISMDSTHVYKFFDIGLAKPRAKDFYLNVDTHHPLDTATVIDFVNLVKSAAKPTLIVGGSYFYLHVLCTGLNQIAPITKEELEKTRSLSEEEKNKLVLDNPDLPIDPYRRERDLSYLINRGFIPKKQDFDSGRIPVLNKEVPQFEIQVERAVTHDRSEKRINNFFESGMLLETRRNLELGFSESKAMGAIGYKECKSYIEDPKFPLIRTIKKNTNRLIRMQSTWSSKMPHLLRFDPEQCQKNLDSHIKKILN